jgi:RNA polymerase sigma factor (sigma-70 family)
MLNNKRVKYSELDVSELSAKLMYGDWKNQKPEFTNQRRRYSFQTFLYEKKKNRKKFGAHDLKNDRRFISPIEPFYILRVEIDDLIDTKISSERDKKIIRDYYFYRKNLREIAEELDITFKTVHKRLKKAIKTLCT